jgi:hypothetical protein
VDFVCLELEQSTADGKSNALLDENERLTWGVAIAKCGLLISTSRRFSWLREAM